MGSKDRSKDGVQGQKARIRTELSKDGIQKRRKARIGSKDRRQGWHLRDRKQGWDPRPELKVGINE
jgi:hypothetical protein